MCEPKCENKMLFDYGGLLFDFNNAGEFFKKNTRKYVYSYLTVMSLHTSNNYIFLFTVLVLHILLQKLKTRYFVVLFQKFCFVEMYIICMKGFVFIRLNCIWLCHTGVLWRLMENTLNKYFSSLASNKCFFSFEKKRIISTSNKQWSYCNTNPYCQ